MAFRRPSGNTPPFPNIYSQNQSLQQQQPTPLSGHPPAPLPHPPHVLSTSSAQNTLSKSMTDASNTTASPTLRNKRPRPADMHAPDTPTSATANAQPTDDGFIADADAGESGADDDEEEGTGKPADKKAGRRKIKIEFIQDKSRRHITFSKRKAGIMKKAYELSTLTGTQVLLLVVSETGLVYTFTTAKLQPLVTQPEGKNLIQACLNAPPGTHPSSMPVGAPMGRPTNPPNIPAPPPATNQPIPGQSPHVANQSGNRNVVGGLAIGNKDDDDDRHNDDADAEGDRRGQSRRRVSTSGASKSGATRSPTSPHTPHLNIPPTANAGGQQSPAGQAQMGMGAGGQPYSPSSATPGGDASVAAPTGQPGMYGHPAHAHNPHMMAPQYYQPPSHWPQPGAPAPQQYRR